MEAFGSQKSDPRGMPEMCRIEIAKPIDSLIFLPGAFSEQKIGSERSARNVSDFHCKPIDSLTFLPFGYPEDFRSQKSDPRGMPEMYEIFIAKPIDSLIFLSFGYLEALRGQKSDPRGMPKMY